MTCPDVLANGNGRDGTDDEPGASSSPSSPSPSSQPACAASEAAANNSCGGSGTPSCAACGEFDLPPDGRRCRGCVSAGAEVGDTAAAPPPTRNPTEELQKQWQRQTGGESSVEHAAAETAADVAPAATEREDERGGTVADKDEGGGAESNSSPEPEAAAEAEVDKAEAAGPNASAEGITAEEVRTEDDQEEEVVPPPHGPAVNEDDAADGRADTTGEEEEDEKGGEMPAAADATTTAAVESAAEKLTTSLSFASNEPQQACDAKEGGGASGGPADEAPAVAAGSCEDRRAEDREADPVEAAEATPTSEEEEEEEARRGASAETTAVAVELPPPACAASATTAPEESAVSSLDKGAEAAWSTDEGAEDSEGVLVNADADADANVGAVAEVTSLSAQEGAAEEANDGADGGADAKLGTTVTEEEGPAAAAATAADGVDADKVEEEAAPAPPIDGDAAAAEAAAEEAVANDRAAEAQKTNDEVGEDGGGEGNADADADAELFFELGFSDYIDLQTRLVLVPLDDGACTGAVVASYDRPLDAGRNGEKNGGSVAAATQGEADAEESTMKDVALDGDKSTADAEAGCDADADVDEAHHHREEEEEEEKTYASDTRRSLRLDGGTPTVAAATAKAAPGDVVGAVLVGIPGLTGENGEEEDDDWTAVDLTFILGAVRGASAPIVLRFRRRRSASGESRSAAVAPSKASSSAGGAGETAAGSDEPTPVDEEEDVVAGGLVGWPPRESGGGISSPSEAKPGSASALLSSRFSRWGSRASSLAAEAKERAKVAMEEAEKLVSERTAAKLSLASSASSEADEEGETGGDNHVERDTESAKAEVKGDLKQSACPGNDGRPPLVPILPVAKETTGSLSDGKCLEKSGEVAPQDVPSSPSDDATESAVADKTEEQRSASSAPNGHSEALSSPPSPPSLAMKRRLLQSPTQSPKSLRPPTWDEIGFESPPCGLFLQMASGGFVGLEEDLEGLGADPPFASSSIESTLSPMPLRRTISNNSIASAGSPSRKGGTVSSSSSVASRKKLARLYPVSNTSVLLVRASPDRPCPAKGYLYQWYRSAGSADGACSNISDSGSDSASDYSSASDGGSDVVAVTGWYALPGATYAAFQPSATDVGHRVRCVVTIEHQQGGVQSDESTTGTFTAVCELPYPIVADSGLFNAARQNFSGRKGVFSNLKGRGNADGRLFRLQLAPSESGSRMRILQVSGSTAEPIHDIQEPILNASAVSAAAGPKGFELIFPSGLPPSAMMVKALCTDGGFQLKAPNRVARESLLLALGIANYCGRPSDLNANTVLFPCTPPGVVVEVDGTEAADVFVKEGNDDQVEHVVAENGDVDVDANRYEEQNPVSSTPLIPFSPKTPGPDTSIAASDEQFQALEDELRKMLEKLFAKEKAVSDLSRRMSQSESARARAESTVTALRSEANTSKAQYKECQRSLRSAEKKIEMHESAMNRMRSEYNSRLSSLEDRIKLDERKTAEYEKTIKALQNEKAVLSAAVEARDGKLSKMEQLQLTVESLNGEVVKGQSVQKQLVDMTAKFNATRTELENAKSSEKKCAENARRLKTSLDEMHKRVEQEKNLAVNCKSQMESANARSQKLKAERNSYKLKADSLSREMSRVCKSGLGVDEIEQIIQEHETMKMEVSLLKTQKRKVVDELEESRRLYERSLDAQETAGVDEDVIRALEQRAELERVVSDLTEYINAKEMQLETMMEVNKTLQNELHLLAKSKMGKDEV